jgi:molybdate transport system substrate-binding protein
MRSPLKPILISVAVVFILIAMLLWDSPRSGNKTPTNESLLMYCAAGIKNPVEALARAYEAEYGTMVRLEYGGSGTMLSRLRVARLGDLYLAGDSSFIEIAREQGLVAEAIPIASMRPVIAVRKGNPDGITTVRDLLREDVRTALANPDAASIGKQTRILLKRMSIWDSIEAVVTDRGVFKPTVNEVANDIKLGAVTAGIVWDATVNQYPELEAIDIEGAADFSKQVTVGILKSTQQPRKALHFARYLGARDKGAPVFARMGFVPIEGDDWAERPEIIYYSGAVNRVAIQETIRDFEMREGVDVKTIYNGCGILVGQMKLGQRPDIYHSCDRSFMRGIEDLFYNPIPLSMTPMMILVAQDNPHKIQGLEDLTQPGLKVGLANEQQSALGKLTADLLKQLGHYEAIQSNVVTNTPTADLLVNQIMTGSLDAVVVYRANAVMARDHLELIPIHQQGANAVQTFAIGRNSQHRRTAERLLAAIQASESIERFRQAGFDWKLNVAGNRKSRDE